MPATLTVLAVLVALRLMITVAHRILDRQDREVLTSERHHSTAPAISLRVAPAAHAADIAA